MEHNLTKGMLCRATAYGFHIDDLGNQAIVLVIDDNYLSVWDHGLKELHNHNHLKVPLSQDILGIEKAIHYAINFAYLDAK